MQNIQCISTWHIAKAMWSYDRYETKTILYNVPHSYKAITFTNIRVSAATLIICVITKIWMGYNGINISNFLFSNSEGTYESRNNNK